MATIECPACGRAVSPRASACPICGDPLAPSPPAGMSPTAIVATMGAILLAALASALVGLCGLTWLGTALEGSFEEAPPPGVVARPPEPPPEPPPEIGPGSIAYLDSLPGFRGLTWGQQPLPEMVCDGKDEGMLLCTRKDERLTFGTVALKDVQYEFGPEGLGFVGLVVKPSDHEALLAGFSELFGPQSDAKALLRAMFPDRVAEIDATEDPGPTLGFGVWVGAKTLALCTSDSQSACSLGTIASLREMAARREAASRPRQMTDDL